MTSRILRFLACLATPVAGTLVSALTKCQAGKEDLAGTTKAFTVQVCNLFGDVCYMNQVELPSSGCATGALKIPHQSCALFPIMSYKGYDRSDAGKLQVGAAGCSISCSGTDCKFNGACVSVQCSLGAGNGFAGPAMTKSGTSSARATGVTNTATQTFEVNTFAAIHTDVGNLKTVLLSRTGNYVGTYARGGSSTGTNVYNYGKLPSMDGNQYGPKACPSSTTLMSAATSTTKDELRMCGNPGKWVYYSAINLLEDKTLAAKYSGDTSTGTVSTSKKSISNVVFLHGESSYRSGTAMDDPRQVYLYGDSTGTSAPVMSSSTITPAKSSGMATPSPDIAGTWRTYAAVFYCTDYARVDLTTCASDKRAIFYVADPNPTPAFGTGASSISGGSSPSPSSPSPSSPSPSSPSPSSPSPSSPSPSSPSTSSSDLSITKCTTGKVDLLDDGFKGAVVQVCNLFGADCVVNHPQIASGDCGTKALKIASKQCKLYPIREYLNYDQSVAANEEMSTYSDYGDYSSGTKISGSALAVQCTLTGTNQAGPAFPGGGVSSWSSFYISSTSRTAVTNTAAAGAMNAVTFAYVPTKARGSKTVFLVRTGDYVGTTSILKKSSGGTTWKVGALPTLGDSTSNYGPVACPTANQKLTSLSTATAAMTKEEARMCGATGKWVYWGATNFLMDKSLQIGLSQDTVGTTATVNLDSMGTPKFLMAVEKYKSTTAIDDPRRYCIKGGTSGACIVNTETITPVLPSSLTSSDSCAPSTASCLAGTWRFFGVAFYCEDYARTDLTACAEASRKVFYIAEPSPNAIYGSAGDGIGSPGGPGAATASGAVRAAASLSALAALAVAPAL